MEPFFAKKYITQQNPHLENLKWEVNRLLHCSLAPSTHKAYSAAPSNIHAFIKKMAINTQLNFS